MYRVMSEIGRSQSGQRENEARADAMWSPRAQTQGPDRLARMPAPLQRDLEELLSHSVHPLPHL